VPRRNIFPQPAHLTAEQAAAIPLAGLTAWRALFTRCRLQKKDRVLIVGIGGGVALFALQFAVATGADVFVTSGSDGKIARAVQLGAKGGVNYRTPDWDKTFKQEVGGFDVIVDSAAGDGFNALVNLANPGARIVLYGAGQGLMTNLNPRPIFWKQVNILGSTMGNPAEFKKMMAFINQRTLVPVVDSVFSLADGNAALQRMANGQQFGKIVLRTAP
jgi:zinc-binding alcohol dehydrogenase/oxidoreductase